MKQFIGALLVAILASIVGMDYHNRITRPVVLSVSDSRGNGTRVTIPPCPTEDSDNCYWMADRQGNGKGRSFVTIDGTTYYFGTSQ